MKKVSFVTLLFLAVSCAGSLQEDQAPHSDGYFKYKVTAKAPVDTKTTLDGTVLSWNKGDKIGLYVLDGVQYNMPFRTEGDGIFDGSFKVTGIKSERVCYQAYYPQTFFHGKREESNLLTATLPSVQKAPFEASADYMVSDKVYDRYDEEDMPELSFVFSNHLFSIIKLTITNSNPKYAEERLLGADLIASNVLLAGDFIIDMSNLDRGVEFLPENATDTVSVKYEGCNLPPVLGIGVKHTLYFVTNSFSTMRLKVRIRTVNYIGEIESSRSFSATRGEVVNLATVDFADLKNVTKNKILLYWGDSIAPQRLTDYLQSLLGNSWTVIRGGIGGDDPWEITGRQGGVQMCLKSACTIPGNSSQKIEVPGIYSTWDGSGDYNPGKKSVTKYTWFQPDLYGVLLNNCIIEGVECKFSYNESSKKYYVQRAFDGEDVDVPAGAIVHSYGSLMYRNAALHVTYMGTNGRSSDTDDLLVKFYKAMQEFAPESEHIVVGFHWVENASRYPGWTQKYRDTMYGAFGDHYLDLHTYGHDNAARLLVATGVYPDESSIPQRELIGSPEGGWPASWQAEDYVQDVHPNEYGSRAIATMVYEKMKELGYLDD